MISLDVLILAVAIFLLLGVIASRASGRLGVPTLLVFLAIGMLAGSEGIGGIYFDDPALAQNLGVIGLIFILYAGGFDTLWTQVRPIVAQGAVLATVGVFITAGLLAAFVRYALGFSWLEAFLLGSIVSSTDAAAVFAILRSRGVALRPPLRPLLELESGSNDPMAIFLTTATIGLITGALDSPLSVAPLFLQQMLIGAIAGLAFGRIMVYVTNHVRLEYEGLYPVLTMGMVLFVYSVTNLIQGNGFLAIYIAGVVMGSSNLIHKRSLIRFHDGLAWLMQIVIFVTLGLLVFPSQLIPIMGAGLLTAAFLMLVARPVSVFLLLAPFRPNLRMTSLVAWVGLRGAVPIVLATYPLIAQVERANEIFNLVFFIVLTSVLLQGSSIPIVARWLGVDEPLRNRPRPPIEFESNEGIQGDLVELELREDSPAVGKRLVEMGLPSGALLVLVGRGNQFFVPSGHTQLEKGDVIYLLADELTLHQVEELLASQRTQPVSL